MALAVAHASGAERIIAIDPLEYRLALARQYGACETIMPRDDSTDVVAEVMRLTDGRGVDVVIEATSDPAVPAQAVDMAALGARIALIGITDETDVTMPTHIARRKGLTIRFVRRSKLAVNAAMGLITSGKLSVDGLVTHHFPLADVQRGFELVESYGDNVFKAVVLPNE
jgi:threonine dehydrogenase-like Zn-dependent dehydrogenase